MASLSTVVWNPGAAKVVADLGPEEWKNYVALEAGNVGDSAMSVKAGESQTMGIRVSVGK